jgi:hypothetical protein
VPEPETDGVEQAEDPVPEREKSLAAKPVTD